MRAGAPPAETPAPTCGPRPGGWSSGSSPAWRSGSAVASARSRSHPGSSRNAGAEIHRHLGPPGHVLTGALATARRGHIRSDHVLQAVAGTGPAVVARCPSAILGDPGRQGVLPFLPQEVLVKAGRYVGPGQKLVTIAVAMD